jgi:hypothetical protein
MKIIFKSFPKKGQAGTDSALIQLFYIMMGVIVLITFVKVILTFLNLDSHSNSEIAKSNANSIIYFQELSTSDTFKDLNDCYTLLKISNIETYQQSKEKEDNYIIIISEDGTYVEKRPKDSDEYYKNLDLSNKNPNFKFNNKQNLQKDITDQGGIFGIPTTFDVVVYTFGKSDPKITLDEDIKYIVLDSTIYENSNFIEENYNKLIDTLENENKYKITTISKSGELEELYSKYLVFEHYKKSLFISNGISSDLFLNSKLCSYTNFKYDQMYKKFNEDHGTNIPQTQYDIYFKFYLNDNELDYNFKWESGPLCYNKNQKLDCNEILTKLNPGLDITDYYEFISSIEEFGTELAKSYPGELGIELKHTYTPLDLETIIERKKEKDIQVYELDVFPSSESFKTKDEIENKGYDKLIDIDNWEMGNEIINFCDEAICDMIFQINNKAYFYTKKDSYGEYKFQSFDESFLKKVKTSSEHTNYKNYEFYFNGELIPNNSIKVHEQDSQNYYLFKGLEIYSGYNSNKYDIVLTNIQYNNIIGDNR